MIKLQKIATRNYYAQIQKGCKYESFCDFQTLCK